jgi:hypothetical protein
MNVKVITGTTGASPISTSTIQYLVGEFTSPLPATHDSIEYLLHDSVLLRYARSPPDLPSQCDGCDAAFSIRHTLVECKKGGLVIIRHNEIQDKLVVLASKAFPIPQFATTQKSIHVALTKGNHPKDDKISQSNAFFATAVEAMF